MAGAALWALDNTLYISKIGVSCVNFHEGIGFRYKLVYRFPEYILHLPLCRSIEDLTPDTDLFNPGWFNT
jgi:hypothetical protein